MLSHYAECNFAEYHRAERRNAVCLNADGNCAECRYVECHHAEWRGVVNPLGFARQKYASLVAKCRSK